MIVTQTGDYGRHEVLHMSAFLGRAVACELADHPQVKANPAWLALADQAAEALAALYQAVGADHMDDGQVTIHAGKSAP